MSDPGRRSDSGPRITEEQARRLWERAAQIQAEAARREEERAKDGGGGQPSNKLLPSPVEEGDPGYSLASVRQAGVEVGIQKEYLDLALGEEAILELEGGGGEGSYDRATKRLLRDDRRAIEARKTFSLPPRLIWLALEDALVSAPNNCDLLEVRGGAPEEGGVAIFEIPYVPRNDGSLRYWAVAADTKRLLARVSPAGNGDRAEVILRVPLRRSRRVAGGLSLGLMGGAGLLGGFGGLGLAALVAGTGAMAAAPLALLMAGGAVGGAVSAGGLSRLGLNAAYRSTTGNLARGIERLLTQIERELERDSSFR